MIQSLWTTVWRFLKTLKTELPYDPAIPLLGTPMLMAAAPLTIART